MSLSPYTPSMRLERLTTARVYILVSNIIVNDSVIDNNNIINAVELFDADSELLDNMTVSFETLDTCFCYGHCGCAVSYSSTKFILALFN